MTNQSSTHLPDALTLPSLRKLIAKNDINDIKELSSIEFAVHLIVTQECSVSVVMTRHASIGLPLPALIRIQEIFDIPKESQSHASQNVETVRKELLGRTHGFFCPKTDQMLWEWIVDGQRYTNGERTYAGDSW